ncbi:MAG: radical SAM protein [Candidatus Pacebacteria bacterium]|nr:radical SAM protein [Candidatus Paceibacterota bacterium]
MKHKLNNKINKVNYVAKRVITKNVLSKTEYALYPNTIYLSVNSTCNARCKMCDVGQKVTSSQFYQHMIGSGENRELSMEKLKELVDEVKEFNPLIAVISTEPLLYRDLFKFSKYVVDNGLEIQITTNGLLLENFASDIIQSGIQNLYISIDGPPAVHNEIRGVPGIFEKAIAGIKKIQELKKETNSNFPRLFVNYTISPLNYWTLYDFLEEVKSLELDNIVFSHLNFVNGEMAEKHNRLYKTILGEATSSCVSMIDPTKIKIDVLAEQIKLVKEKYGKLCSFSPDLDINQLYDFYNVPEKIIAQKRCIVMWNSTQIMADGSVIPMTRCFKICLGNINDNDFKEIWNGAKMKTFRRKMKKIKLTPACTRCCAVF